MKHAAWFLLALFCTPAFGQLAPDPNTVAAGATKHIESLKLFDSPGPIQLPVLTARIIVRRKVCAIPLLTVNPSTDDRMPIVKPPASGEPNLQVPAPACNEQ
jgi:hypothetical protein